MTFKLFAVILLLTTGFGFIQNQPQTLKDVSMWPRNAHMIEMKELEATFKDELLSNSKESISTEETDDASSEDMVRMDSGKDQMKTNMLKRETEPKVLIADKIKRQTSIKGNGNRLKNLINLPTKLNVLANVLSQLNQGVIDSKRKPLSSTSIIGNNNEISSLVNLPIDADAVVNVLSNIDHTNSGSANNGGERGVLGGLLGGLSGGGSDKGDQGLLGGLLGGLLEDGDGSDLLGDTLGDLLGALLGGEGLVGNLLGGVDGQSAVTDLLNGLLGGVGELVDNLLELLVGILEGLLSSLSGLNEAVAVSSPTESTSSGTTSNQSAAPQGTNIQGNNNRISSLINAPLRINALINVLSSLKQEIRRQVDPAAAGNHAINIQGNNNEVSSLVNLPVDLDLNVNALSSLLRSGENGVPAAGTNTSSASFTQSSLSSSLSSISESPASSRAISASPSAGHGSTNIKGNSNVISSLVNVVPDVNVNLDILSEVTELLGGSKNSDATSTVIERGSNPNEICFDIPISQADTSIIGNNNKISNAINVKPKISIDLNLLSNVKHIAGSKVPTHRVCLIKPTKPLTPVTATPVPHTSAPPTPVVTPMPVAHTPATSTPVSLLPETSTPASYTSVLHTPAPPSSVVCFDVLVDQFGTVISGNNNHISNLINVDPKINLNLNLLSNSQQSSPQSNHMVKRICIPASTDSTSAPSLPTNKPINNPPADSRCFRRTCIKWGHFSDYNCLNNANEYPTYTYPTHTYPSYTYTWNT